MALRQSQELKQSLKLSPLQVQTIKLIECNALEFEDKIKQEVEDNPAIEITDFAEETKDDFSESNDDISLRVFDYKKPEWHNIFLHKGNKFNSVREMNVFIIDKSRIVEKDMIERL